MYQGLDMGGGFRIHRLYTAFEEAIESDYFFVGERHDFWELVVAEQGAVGVTAGEDAWVLEAGQAVLHGPMEFHRIWYSGAPGRIIVFSFDAEGLSPEAAGSFCFHDTARVRKLLEDTRKHFCWEGIFVTGMKGQEIDAQLCMKAWEVFLLELIRQKITAHLPERSRPAQNYATIVQVLERNIHQNLSVEEIAALCSMSPISVKQTFSRYAGMGIINFYNRLKIQAAIPLLQRGDAIQEIAAAFGFSSQNYFCTVFKRIMGMSPSQYRKNLK